MLDGITQSDIMDGRKDISDMSFEEFFSKKDEDVVAPIASDNAVHERTVKPAADVKRGFATSGPKLNLKDGGVVLYIPRYTGGENDRFETAIECGDNIIPTGRLNATRQLGARVTSACNIGLEPHGISPFDGFKLTIDGICVYENRSRPVLYFNGSGLPIGRPNGHVFVVCRSGISLRTSRAELLSQKEDRVASIFEYDVSLAGGIWVDDGSNTSSDIEDSTKEPVKTETVSESKEVAVKKATSKPAVKAKKVKPKVAIALPQSIGDAEVMCCGQIVPVYREMPAYTMSFEGCEQDDCVVTIKDASDKEVAANGREGFTSICVSIKDHEISRTSLFIIPDFACEYSGNGDIPDDPSITYTMFGQSYDTTVYDPAVRGPFTHDNVSFEVHWKVPTVTLDLGSGAVPLEPIVTTIDNLDSDFMVVTVRGAKKKKLYFGPEKGKKRDMSPEWVGDSISVDLASIKSEIFSAGNVSYCFYISVNSFPNRMFLTIENPMRMVAKYVDGSIEADVSVSGVDCVCRLYMMDKSVKEVALTQGHNSIPVPAESIEAEVVELHNGTVRNSIAVKIRQLPFLSKELGDYWMYVSKDKRIPLPGGLIKGGVADMNEVKQWHARIVRMNPELKNVTLAMMQKAFSEI